ncbi:MAG: enoyl-CoA hydratase/isomerase family protein [Sphingomonadaceae bacterium]|nr:enoyl-CoA hydratase/isomerase family protein [Sphingomonadaceae bacterium]
MSDKRNVLVERKGAVSKVIFNCPEQLNAFTPEVAIEIAQVMAGEVEGGARALIVTGNGRGFCSGANLAGAADAGGADLLGLMEDVYKPLARAFADSPVPIVTAVNGVAAGAGASLAFAGDIIIAARSANFVFTFANLGLTPDVGGTWLVARAAGRVRALEMALLTGKMSAEKACNCDLVTEVVDDEELMARAMEVAEKLAAMPTKTLGLIRQLVRDAIESSFEQSLEAEAQAQNAATKSRDFKEGMTAFAQRRAPNFTGQ